MCKENRSMTYALWTVQVLLAVAFALAGGIKLALPIDVLQEQMQLSLPGVFIRFIGVVEVLGALGLIPAWSTSSAAGPHSAGSRWTGGRHAAGGDVHSTRC